MGENNLTGKELLAQVRADVQELAIVWNEEGAQKAASQVHRRAAALDGCVLLTAEEVERVRKLSTCYIGIDRGCPSCAAALALLQ